MTIRRPVMHASTGAVVLAALALGTFVAHAEAPGEGQAQPQASGQGQGSAAAPAPAGSPSPTAVVVAVPPDAPTIASDVPGAEKSAAPSAPEWSAAKPVKLTRRGPGAASCAATRVREWLRVRCQTPTFAISLLGGLNEGISFWIGGEDEGRFGEVQLPLRRGDRRVVQLWAAQPDKTGASVVAPSLVLQELWPDGDAAPTVTVL